ncbi:MAG: hypothetical protein ACTHMG_06740 [Sphingomonas sp.]
MRAPWRLITLSAAALAMPVAASPQSGATQQPQASPCPGVAAGMGPMMMGKQSMGSGMMGNQPMGPGMMQGGRGHMGWRSQVPPNGELSADDVKAQLDGWLSRMGNPHVRSGSVAVKDKDTIVANVVTTDKGGLVQRFDVDRHSGTWTPAR